MRARRRRRLVMGGCVAVALIVTSAISIPDLGGADLAAAAIEKAKSFLELMQQRSPGKRTKAQLAMTKHKVALHQRALPKVRMAVPILPPEFPPQLIDIVAPPIPIRTASLEALPIPPIVGEIIPPGIPFGPPPGIIVPPLSPPHSPPQPPPQPPPVVTPFAAVPEPATWMSMLLGFGLIGWQARRRRANRKHAPTS